MSCTNACLRPASIPCVSIVDHVQVTSHPCCVSIFLQFCWSAACIRRHTQLYVYAVAHIHTNTNTHTHTNRHTHTHMHQYTSMHALAHIRARTHVVWVCVYVCITVLMKTTESMCHEDVSVPSCKGKNLNILSASCVSTPIHAAIYMSLCVCIHPHSALYTLSVHSTCT